MAPTKPPTHQQAHHDDPAADPFGRLWFHLDDVLPLALHAVTTAQCGLTAAQLLAGAPLLPALIWEATTRGDLLTSNGKPEWCDADGQPHAARARIWLSPERRHSPALGQVGYLPLRSLPDSRFQVVDWLRQAAAVGGHWLSIDLTRRSPVIGLDQLDVTDQCGDTYPPDAAWTTATVACVPQTGSGRYPALVAEGYRSSHGGALVRFDRDTVTQMMTDLHRARVVDGYQPGSHAVLRWAADRVEVCDENPNGVEGLRRYDVVGPDRDGRYPLGAHLWPWLRLDDL